MKINAKLLSYKEQEQLYDELRKYGYITSDIISDDDRRRITTYRYKDKAWYVHLYDNDLIEAFEI